MCACSGVCVVVMVFGVYGGDGSGDCDGSASGTVVVCGGRLVRVHGDADGRGDRRVNHKKKFSVPKFGRPASSH